MLAANDAVALVLKRKQKPVVYRVHEDPDFAKLNSFAEVARGFGYKVGDLSNRVHVQQLLPRLLLWVPELHLARW
jgi:ribonuclease R